MQNEHDLSFEGVNPALEPTSTENDKEVKTVYIAPQSKPSKEKRTWKATVIMSDIIHNLSTLLDSIYSLTKKIMRFWWVFLVVLILFYPAPILGFLKGFVETIEQIKNLF